MSEADPAPGIAHVDSLGRRMSVRGREAQLAALARGRTSVVSALKAQQEMGSEESLRVEIRQIALRALPAALRNMAKIASGRDPKASRSAQVAASQLLGQFACVEMEARAQTGRGAGPLSEMALSELEQSLRGTLDNVHQLQAIEGTAELVPEPSEPLESESESLPAVGTAAAGAGAVEP